VTLYDFQLAERMNKDFKITAKEFKLYPLLSRSAWASILIFVASYFIIQQLLSFWITFNFYPYPSHYMRTGELYLIKPYIVQPWSIPEDFNKVKSEEELNELVEKHTDEFSFKTALFRDKGLH